jgi:hypothetical protein
VDGLLNPILVREIRQAVRSRFVTGLLLLFLAGELVIVWIYVMANPHVRTSLRAGTELSLILSGVLFAACLVFVPLYTGVRLAVERAPEQVDLMFSTSITPGALVRGKMWSAAALTLLIFSACMPFLTFTYLLRGVDLVALFAGLGAVFLQVLLASQAAVLVACVPASRVMKVLLGLFATGVLIYWAGGGIAAGTWLLVGAPGGPFMGLGSAIWWAVALMVGGTLTFLGMLHVLAIALVAPKASNRMLRVRLYETGVWLAWGIVAVVATLTRVADVAVFIWAHVSVFALSLYLFTAVSERTAWGPRVRRHIPRLLPARVLAFLFYSGAAGGLVWACLLALATLAVLAGTRTAFGPSYPGADDTPWRLGGYFVHMLAYALLGSALQRALQTVAPSVQPVYTWLLGMAVFAVGAVAPPLLLILAGGWQSHTSLEAAMFLNPFWVLGSEQPGPQLVAAVIMACVGGGIAAPWASEQMARFKPLPPPAPEPAAAAPAGPDLRVVEPAPDARSPGALPEPPPSEAPPPERPPPDEPPASDPSEPRATDG